MNAYIPSVFASVTVRTVYSKVFSNNRIRSGNRIQIQNYLL